MSRQYDQNLIPSLRKVSANAGLTLNINQAYIPVGPSLIPPPQIPIKEEAAFIGNVNEAKSWQATQSPLNADTAISCHRPASKIRSRYVLPPQLASGPQTPVPSPSSSNFSKSNMAVSASVTPQLFLPSPPPIISDEPFVSVANSPHTSEASVVSEPLAPMNPFNEVKAHWFYASKMNSMTIWWPFDLSDSDRLETESARLNLISIVSEDTISSSELRKQNTISVRGGRYDVYLHERHCKAVYWEEERAEVRRVTWFFRPQNEQRLLPFSEKMCALLEERYKLSFSWSTWGQKFSLPSEEDLQFEDSFVFHGPESMIQYRRFAYRGGCTDSFDDSPSMDPSNHLCFLSRGLPAEMLSQLPLGDDRPVAHLVFAIHGIGSVHNVRGEGLVACVNDMRRTAESLLASHFPQATGRVEFLPVQWHSALHSEATGINNQLRRVTLRSIPKLRNYTNGTLTDILFYSSPKYCQHIIDTVTASILRLRRIFLIRNPMFVGTFSIVGHSLGSVIAFDLLSHQRRLASTLTIDAVSMCDAEVISPPDDGDVDRASIQDDEWSLVTGDQGDDSSPTDEMAATGATATTSSDESLGFGDESDDTLQVQQCEQLKKRLASANLSDEQMHVVLDTFIKTKKSSFSAGVGMPIVRYPQLGFPIAACFLLGSPLPVFLTARGIDRLPNDFRLPTCPSVFNIFHPFDPVAYRMETMLVPDYTSCAVLMPHHKGRKRMHLELKDNLARVGADIKSRVYESLRSTWRTLQEFASAHTAPVTSPEFPSGTEDSEETNAIKRVLSRLTDDCAPDSSASTDEAAEDEEEASMFSSHLNQGRRLDFVLQEAPLESLNDYLFALTSHAVYWESQDCILFMLNELMSERTRLLAPKSFAKEKMLPDVTLALQGAMLDQPTPSNSHSSQSTSMHSSLNVSAGPSLLGLKQLDSRAPVNKSPNQHRNVSFSSPNDQGFIRPPALSVDAPTVGTGQDVSPTPPATPTPLHTPASTCQLPQAFSVGQSHNEPFTMPPRSLQTAVPEVLAQSNLSQIIPDSLLTGSELRPTNNDYRGAGRLVDIDLSGLTANLSDLQLSHHIHRD